MDSEQIPVRTTSKPHDPIPAPLSDLLELPDAPDEELLPAAGHGVTDDPAEPDPAAPTATLPYQAANHIPAPAHQPGQQIAAETAESPQLHDMNDHAPATPIKRSKSPEWLQHTRYYLAEYLLTSIFLIGFIVACNYPIYFLVSYLLGDHSSARNNGSGMLMTFSFSIILLPLLIILTRRTVSEEQLHPARHDQHVRKIIANISIVYAILGAVGYGLAAVYLVLSPLLRENSASDALGYAAASFVMLFMHLLLAWLTSKSAGDKPSRVGLTLLLATGTLIISGAAFAVTIGPTRGYAHDRTTLQDLSSISTSVNSYAKKTGSLPDSLSEASIDKAILKRASERGYQYEPQGSISRESSRSNSKPTSGVSYNASLKQRYKLCATFKYATEFDSSATRYPEASVSTYEDHPAGYYCFQVQNYDNSDDTTIY